MVLVRCCSTVEGGALDSRARTGVVPYTWQELCGVQLRPRGGALVRSLNTNTFRWGYYVLIIRKASGGGGGDSSRNVIDDLQWQVSPQACGTRLVQRWKLVPFWEANGKWAGGGWDPGYVYN